MNRRVPTDDEFIAFVTDLFRRGAALETLIARDPRLVLRRSAKFRQWLRTYPRGEAWRDIWLDSGLDYFAEMMERAHRSAGSQGR